MTDEILISIDDTDDIDTRGHRRHGRAPGARASRRRGLARCGRVTRHQLLVHPDIAYTSHNSSMCFPAEIDGSDWTPSRPGARRRWRPRASRRRTPGCASRSSRGSRGRTRWSTTAGRPRSGSSPRTRPTGSAGRAGRPPVRARRDGHRRHRRARRRRPAALGRRRPLQGQVRDPGRRGSASPWSPASGSAASTRSGRSDGEELADDGARVGRRRSASSCCLRGGAVLLVRPAPAGAARRLGRRRSQGAAGPTERGSLEAGRRGAGVRFVGSTRTTMLTSRCREGWPRRAARTAGTTRTRTHWTAPLSCFGCRYRRWAPDGFTCLKGLLAE